MNCKICLGLLKKNEQIEGYHTTCIRKLFGSIQITPTLDFTKRDFIEISKEKSKGMSISGVQKKLSMHIVNHKLEPTDIGGSYILKPTPFEYPEVSENEHLSMLIGASLDIKTPPLGLVSFSDGELAYIIKRYDRSVKDEKLHQEDLTQAMALARDKDGKYKYSNSYEKAAHIIFEATGRKQAPVLRFFERLIYNYLICNGDYHLKNISLIRKIQNRTPFYDGISPNYDSLHTKFYFPGEHDMALDMFDDDFLTEAFQKIGFITNKDFVEFGKKINLTNKIVESTLKKFESKKATIINLVQSSYLSNEKKEVYLQELEDRYKRLTME